MYRERMSLDDFRVAIGDVLHHVTPMAPHRAEIEKHEAVFLLRALENCLRPRMPFDGFFRARGADWSQNASRRMTKRRDMTLEPQVLGPLARGESLDQGVKGNCARTEGQNQQGGQEETEMARPRQICRDR